MLGAEKQSFRSAYCRKKVSGCNMQVHKPKVHQPNTKKAAVKNIPQNQKPECLSQTAVFSFIMSVITFMTIPLLNVYFVLIINQYIVYFAFLSKLQNQCIIFQHIF